MNTDKDFKYLLVMGVAGCGKSHVARGVSDAMGFSFIEADDYHPRMNVQRMSQGLPLNDDLRWPWLAAVAKAAKVACANKNAPVVIACSALKKRYRDYLSDELEDLQVLYLKGDESTIRRRLLARSDHYMQASMLESQLADLEPPSPRNCWVIDITPSKNEVLQSVLSRVQTIPRVI